MRYRYTGKSGIVPSKVAGDAGELSVCHVQPIRLSREQASSMNNELNKGNQKNAAIVR